MEFLRKLALQTQEHLKGLTPSQRLAIGACTGLIAVALLWLVNWAGTPDMVPLLDQRLSPEELGRITQTLDTSGIDYRTTGETVLIRSDQRAQVQAQLAQRNALPDDISIGFDKIIENGNPWLSNSAQDRRWGVAKANELAKVIRHMEGVREAHVFLDEKMKRTIGQPSVQPTASISVKLAPGIEMTHERVFGFANFVAKAVPGLLIENVGVTDARTGMSHTVPDSEAAIAFDDIDIRRKQEKDWTQKIQGLLAGIPGVKVAVYAELDRKATEITKSEYGEKVPLKDRSETYESTETDPALEPGVVSNVTPNAPVAAGGSKTEKNLTEVTYAGQVDATVTRSEVARFGLMSLRVAVSVPRSFLVALFKRGNEGKEPTDQELIEYLPVKETIDKIESLVEGVLPNPQQTQSTVVVQWFPDDAVMSFAEMMEAGSGAGMMDYVHNYGSKAGMAALALFSLIMMMLMVRRVGEGPVLPGEEPPDPSLFKKNKKRRGDDEDPEELFVAGGPVGEAEVSEHLLEGREVDETTLHIQKIVEQVADMVSDDPATSAGILQRWIDSDKQ